MPKARPDHLLAQARAQAFFPGFEPDPEPIADHEGQLWLPGVEPPPPPQRAEPSLRELGRRYLAYLEARVARDDYNREGFADLRRDLGRFFDARLDHEGHIAAPSAPFINGKLHGDKTLADCRQRDLADFLAANPQWRSASVHRRVTSYVIACFNWLAHEDQSVPKNPYRRPKGLAPAGDRREATDAEYVALMRSGTPRHVRRVLFLLWNTGCRPSEIFTLERTKVLHPLGVIEVKNKARKRQGGDRMAGATPKVLRLLANLGERARRGDVGDRLDGLLVLNRRGRPWVGYSAWTRNSFGHKLAARVAELGLAADLTAYTIRHAYTTQADEAGVDGRKIDAQIGHSDGLRMLSHYSKARQKARYLHQVAAEIEAKRNAQRRQQRKEKPHGDGTGRSSSPSPAAG